MPIGYPTTYPAVQDAMILARSLVNDTFPGATATPGEGQILTNSSTISPFTIPFMNSAIRKVYRKLGNSGVATLIQDNYIVPGLTPVNGASGVGIPDPAVQVALTYSGYFDGTNLNAALILPANCLSVLKMWERQTGSGNPFTPMVQAQAGLESRNQITYLGDWEWRGGSVTVASVPVFGDGVYMVGCVNAVDVRLRMSVSLPSSVSGSGADFANIFIPVLDCTDAVANYIAAFYTAARGEDDPDILGRSKIFTDAGDEYVAELINRQIRAKQSINYTREDYNNGSGSGSGGWGNTGAW
jgi:hypothetical protein